MRRRRGHLDDSVADITDALLTASRLLVAMSALSMAHVDESIAMAQFRALVTLSTHGPSNLTALAAQLDVQPSTIPGLHKSRLRRPSAGTAGHGTDHQLPNLRANLTGKPLPANVFRTTSATSSRRSPPSAPKAAFLRPPDVGGCR